MKHERSNHWFLRESQVVAPWVREASVFFKGVARGTWLILLMSKGIWVVQIDSVAHKQNSRVLGRGWWWGWIREALREEWGKSVIKIHCMLPWNPQRIRKMFSFKKMKHERVRLEDCYKFENKLNYTANQCLKNYKTNNKKMEKWN